MIQRDRDGSVYQLTQGLHPYRIVMGSDKRAISMPDKSEVVSELVEVVNEVLDRIYKLEQSKEKL